MKNEIIWGPLYDADTSRFVSGSTGATRFFRDEAWDVLVGDENGRPMCPLRLKCRRDISRAFKDFQKTVNRSWKVVVDEGDGEIVLLHEVKPGNNRESVGERNTKFGWKIVPAKAYVVHIIAQVPPTL